MAKDDEEQKPEEGEEKGGGASKLLLIIAIVNTLGLLGLAAYVVLGSGPGQGDSPEAMAEAAAMERLDGQKPKENVGPMVELGTLLVNLREPAGDRYLKTRLQLELDGESTQSEVQGRMTQIKYQLTMLLSGQRVADVQGPENIEALRKTMTRRANAVLSKGRIVDVWPDEWIVQ